MAGLFFRITIVKLIIKIRLYTVFESPWSSSHKGIITIDSSMCILWLLPYIFVLLRCVFTEVGSYYIACTAVPLMPDQEPGHHLEFIGKAESQAPLMNCWIII